MRRIALINVLCLLCICVQALDFKEYKLYPDGAPDSNGYTVDDELDYDGQWRKVADPLMWIYLPEGESKGTILFAPGGGYEFLGYYWDGVLGAEWFVPRGYAFVVLKYRVPNGHPHIPLEDACQAMEMLHRNAVEYGLNPNAPFGVMGVSAGGHLAASLVTKYRSEEARPDYGILVYPVISLETATHGGSRQQLLGDHPSHKMIVEYSLDKQVTENTPPCFIVACQDDDIVPVAQSLMMYQALTDHHVVAEMFLAPQGFHGWCFGRHFPHRELYEATLLAFLNDYARK